MAEVFGGILSSSTGLIQIVWAWGQPVSDVTVLPLLISSFRNRILSTSRKSLSSLQVQQYRDTERNNCQKMGQAESRVSLPSRDSSQVALCHSHIGSWPPSLGAHVCVPTYVILKFLFYFSKSLMLKGLLSVTTLGTRNHG